MRHDPALKTGSKCSCTACTLRLLADFCLDSHSPEAFSTACWKKIPHASWPCRTIRPRKPPRRAGASGPAKAPGDTLLHDAVPQPPMRRNVTAHHGNAPRAPMRRCADEARRRLLDRSRHLTRLVPCRQRMPRTCSQPRTSGSIRRSGPDPPSRIPAARTCRAAK